jgi:hypothetical protein
MDLKINLPKLNKLCEEPSVAVSTPQPRSTDQDETVHTTGISYAGAWPDRAGERYW